MQDATRHPWALGHAVEQIHHLGEQRRGGDGEAGVLHVVRVGRAVAAQGAQEREDVFADHAEHLGRDEVLKARPAQVVIRPRIARVVILSLGENAALHGLLEPNRLVLLQRVQVIQPAQEKQVSDLLDDLQRVRDPARPEGVPNGVDLPA